MKRLFNLLLVLPLLLASSCISDELDNSKPGIPKGDAVDVRFSVRIPATAKPTTYALSADDENEIKDVDVLVFKINGDASETFVYRTQGSSIQNTSNSQLRSFKVQLLKTDANHRYVVLANARTEVNNLIVSYGEVVPATVTKQDMLSQLVCVKDIWGSTTGTHTGFPMWGESVPEKITDSKVTMDGISLLRAVASINITVGGTPESVAAQGEFEMTAVHVYNTKKQGRIVPDAANMGLNADNKLKALQPTVPMGSDREAEHSIPYTVSAAEKHAFLESMYLFETNSEGINASQATCLVIGGRFIPAGTAAGDIASLPVTWYRVDLFDKSTPPKYDDWLRNHKYKFNITKVGGAGYPTPKDAFDSRSMNMVVDVVVWDDGVAGDVIFDGQYYLSIKPDMVFNFFKDADQNSVKVKTDVPEGFQIIKITEADGTTANSGWLSTDKAINSYYGMGETEIPVSIIVTENTTPSPRTGYIYIKAGRLEAKLTINQDIKAKKQAVFYFIEYVNVNGTGQSVPWAGGKIQAKVNTNMGWTLKTSINGVEASMVEPVTEIASDYTLSVNIPATADEWSGRISKVWIEYNGLRLQETTFTQTGYHISPSGVPSSVNKSGQDVTLSLSGYFPPMNFRAVDAADASKAASNVVACTATGSAAANGSSTVTLTVYPNGSGANRNIRFQYEKSPGVWVDIATASQQWNGKYFPTAGMIAPPGVIGVGATTGKLTLDGSKEYPDGTAGETVYVVYFKWGSMVAMSGGTGVNGDTFDKMDIAWLPEGFAGTITDDYTTVPSQSQSSSSFPAQNPTGGLGDPCRLASKDGITGGYRIPTGNPYEQFTDGGWLANYSAGVAIPGRWSNYGSTKSQFYPASGYRRTTGSLNDVGTSGDYWSGSPSAGSYASSLYFDSASAYPGISYGGERTLGFAVRCVRE